MFDILRCLAKPGSQLVASDSMPTAIIVRGDQAVMTVDSPAGEYFRAFDMIQITSAGRVSIYRISISGMHLIEGRKSQSSLRDQPSEAPLERLGYSRGGEPAYIAADLIKAGQRIRAEYQALDQGLSSVRYWQQVATGRPIFPDDAIAFHALDPDLAAIVLLVCCQSAGLEEAEASLGWPARSGRLVLRIALKRLAAHYRIMDAAQPAAVERQEGRLVAAGDLVLDPEERIIMVNGRRLHLSPSQHEILSALILRGGRMVSMADISATIEDRLGRDGPDSRSIAVLVVRLRRQLRAAGSRAEVKSVRGESYRLEAASDAARP